MSKQYNIRWGRSDYSRLSHLIRKTNQKIFEIEVKRPDIAEYQPQMLDYQEVKASITTRRDLNNFINKYNRYLREGVEEVEKSSRGAVATKWDINEFAINQNAENRRRETTRQRLGEKDVTVGGKPTGAKRKEMGKIKENAVKPSKKKFKNMSMKEWEYATRLMDKRMRDSYSAQRKMDMLSNYVKGLTNEGYSDELLQIMNKIPLDKFTDIVDTDEIATFDFIYDPIELKAREERLIELWKEYVDENVDNQIDYQSITKSILDKMTNDKRKKKN